jgi:hypothetical protein
MAQGPTDKKSPQAMGTVTPLERALSGEVYRTVLGGLRGVYELEAQATPPVRELQAAVAARVAADRRSLRRQRGELRLVDWCGGWTPGGRGIFEAEIVVDGGGRRWRPAGRVRVVVRPGDGVLRWRVLEKAS